VCNHALGPPNMMWFREFMEGPSASESHSLRKGS
jgi:hypothetical protein